jgi:ABC-type glycerol-3-phosphate transport system permease component
MNRAYYIILIPALLVSIGYVLVFRAMGLSPTYWILIFPAAIFGGAVWWLRRRTARKAGVGAQ